METLTEAASAAACAAARVWKGSSSSDRIVAKTVLGYFPVFLRKPLEVGSCRLGLVGRGGGTGVGADRVEMETFNGLCLQIAGEDPIGVKQMGDLEATPLARHHCTWNDGEESRRCHGQPSPTTVQMALCMVSGTLRSAATRRVAIRRQSGPNARMRFSSD